MSGFPGGQLRSLSVTAVDLLIAASLALAAELELRLSSGFPGSVAAVAVGAPVMTLAISGRRRFPVASMSVVYLAYVAQALAGGYAEQSIVLALTLLISIYSVAVHAADSRVAMAAFGLGQVAAWAVLIIEGGHTPGDYAFSVLLGGGAWVGGYAVRTGRLVATRLEHRMAHAESMSAAEREQAIADERSRIAREMHDVLAHTMSVVVVQTGAARQLVRSQPERSEAMLQSVERTSREALSEMRRLLGLIRADGQGVDVTPQPGLDGLDGLVDRARAAGLRLTVERTGDPVNLPAGLDLAAYRIAQEAITNALKHGSGPAHLLLRYDLDAVHVEVDNEVSDQPHSTSGAGHGLIGMRERASLYGGSFSADQTANRFTVRARLPIARELAAG